MTEADATTKSLARDWMRWCGALGDPAIAHEADGATLAALGVPAPPLNVVICTRADVTAKPVEHLLEVARERRLPHQLELRPGATSELVGLARSRGMRPGETIPLMRRDASGGDLSAIARRSDLAIRELDAAEAALHISIASVGFEVPDSLFETLMTPAVFAVAGFHCYVGFVSGQPVTTALGIVDADHVGIYNVATIPSHRGRGYGSAITAAALLDGFDAGAPFALLQSSEAGYGVYQALGFRTLESWTAWVSAPAG